MTTSTPTCTIPPQWAYAVVGFANCDCDHRDRRTSHRGSGGGLGPPCSRSCRQRPRPTQRSLAAIMAGGSTLFVARVDGRIVGSLTLVLYRIPTGLKAWIEDVVVDEAARGHGVGEALELGRTRRGSPARRQAVSLTSRPSRSAANRLYQRIGFSPATPTCTATTCEPLDRRRADSGPAEEQLQFHLAVVVDRQHDWCAGCGDPEITEHARRANRRPRSCRRRAEPRGESATLFVTP